MGEEQSSSTQTSPKGKWVGIELQQWRDPTLKEPPDNSSFQEMAVKHQGARALALLQGMAYWVLWTFSARSALHLQKSSQA